MLEEQTGHVLKQFRTDGGREYKHTLFAQWLASKGAVWEPTSRESPQQNASECLNCMLWDRVRPMMLLSCLGSYFLPYAFHYAVLIRNLTPAGHTSLLYVRCKYRCFETT